MNKAFAPICVALAVTACATTQEDEAAKGSGKLGVVQASSAQYADHVFCETDRCPQRTPKYLPKPVEQKKVIAPAPSQQPALPQTASFKVHFRWGWSQLDADGRKEVESVTASSHLRNAKKIVVAGRTDPTGSRKANEKLALRRAETVKAALVLAGVSADAITAEAQAPCCDGDKKATQAVMRELRRTDIDITITTK